MSGLEHWGLHAVPASHVSSDYDAKAAAGETFEGGEVGRQQKNRLGPQIRVNGYLGAEAKLDRDRLRLSLKPLQGEIDAQHMAARTFCYILIKIKVFFEEQCRA